MRPFVPPSGWPALTDGYSGTVCLTPRRILRTAKKPATEAAAKTGRLTSRGARFPAALRAGYALIALPLRPAARAAMPAPCAVLAGPLRLTLSRTESVIRAGVLLRRPPATRRSLSTARAFLLLRRPRFMAGPSPARNVASRVKRPGCLRAPGSPVRTVGPVRAGTGAGSGERPLRVRGLTPARAVSPNGR